MAVIDYFFQLAWTAKIGIFFLAIIVFIYIWLKSYLKEETQIKFIIKRVRNHFAFLFDKGFEIVNTHYSSQHFGNWSVDLRLGQYAIGLINDRNYVQIQIIPQIAFRRDTFDLESLIDFIEGKNSTLKSLEKKTGVENQLKYLANLLNSHYDQIISFLNREDFIQEKQKYKSKHLIYK